MHIVLCLHLENSTDNASIVKNLAGNSVTMALLLKGALLGDVSCRQKHLANIKQI